MNNKIGWIVFGASSEIGNDLVKILTKNSEKVFAVGRDQKINLEDLKSLELNVVMLNGKVFFKKFIDITNDDIDKILDANLISTITFLQKLFGANLNIKKVLVVGSRAGQHAQKHKYFSLYAAAKTACLGLLRSLSAEFPEVLFTFYICPSTDTGIFKRGLVDQNLLEEVKSNENTIKKTTTETADYIRDFLKNQNENLPNLILE